MTECKGYEDWKKFGGNEIPSSLKTFDTLYRHIKKEEPIVDIGCGFGKTVFELASRNFGPVCGFDINVHGIENAMATAKTLPKEIRQKLRFEVEDALETSYSESEFTYGIMQAFLTTLSNDEHRKKALAEARRIISPQGGLYLAVFMQTWHNEKMRRKYEKGEKETGEVGSFKAYNKVTGELEYVAHHYSERELVCLLLEAGFCIEEFHYRVFTTRGGNRVNGAVVWAK